MENIWKYIALILSNILVYMYLGENVLFVTVMISLILVIIINIKTREYICNNCKHRFSIKFHQIISFHAGNYRKLKCPVCDAVTLAEEVNKYKNDTFNSAKKISKSIDNTI